MAYREVFAVRFDACVALTGENASKTIGDPMTKLLAASLPILGLILASSPASAKVTTVSGNACTPTNDSINCATPGQWGMGNACSSQAITVFCPLTVSVPTGGSVGLNDITFWAFDRSSDNVSCDFHMTDESGTDIFTPSTASTNVNRAAVEAESFSLGGINANGSTMWASCHIPASTSSGFSHLVTFKITTND